MFADILFVLFATMLLVGGLGVITARNPMYCVLFLVLAFVNATGLFLLLGAEFLALLLIMVYVGAITVMFLFVLMTIDIDFTLLREGFARYLPVGLIVGGVLMAELLFAAWTGLFTGGVEAVKASLPMTEAENTMQLGQILFTNYVYPFLGVSIVLLIAMVGAIVLTHRKRPNVKRQNIADQVARKREDAVELVKVTPGKGVDI